MGNTLKVHLDTASKTGVCQLSNAKLKEFPPELAPISGRLRTLDISLNKIRVLPASLGNFVQLKQLNLSHNKLTCLPNAIGLLRKLDNLNCEGNSLKELPPDFVELSALRFLNLADNQFTRFPLEVCSLSQLEVLDMSNNRMTSLPDAVATLTATEVNLNRNQLSQLSEGFSQCPRLKVLRVEENCLSLDSIPNSLLVESKISLLAFDGNLFDQKDFQAKEGYEQYMERYTATKKKMF